MGSKVLVVDDSKASREKLVTQLEKNGVSAAQAVNGEEGIKYLEQCDNIDMVFVDAEMHVMDGVSMVLEMKKDPKLNKIPVIMIINIDPVAQTIGKVMFAGANGFMLNPPTEGGINDFVNRFSAS
ncbi:MAG: hypothetical protein CMP10_19885 [Zetaproteobacteria bacterium]|nr:hypothetical protein [Pseudobdellovibrionaceae bacterium]